MNNNSLSSQDYDLLSGAALLRKSFFPRQRLSITELSHVLGMSRDRVYKRINAGLLGVKITKDECGKQFARLDDVISYLYPASDASQNQIECEQLKKRGPGRPRKQVKVTGNKKIGGDR